mgnify:FL=1|tara:strand:- start:3653 stop:4399 length:747 start_codon:yes stop_codon:yes gene_type:complete
MKDKITTWLKDYATDNDMESFVVGVSGGIDSAVSSTLAARTGMKTYVLIMPIYQNPEETSRGYEHCKWLHDKYPNVEMIPVELSDVYDTFKNSVPEKFNNELALANTRARIRMTTLYMIAGSTKGLVVGTGNKVEDFGVGFYTKYGDGGVDISPIGDLMKSEVYELAKDLGIVQSIIDAPPTDGLWEDRRTDEDQLGVSYEDLEWAMKYSEEPIGELSDIEEIVLETYNKHRKANMHKMVDIPVFKEL